MIEFNGKITGKADKHYWMLERRLAQKIILVVTLLILPIIALVSISAENWFNFVLFTACFAILQLLLYIPKSRKEKELLMPNKIFVDGEYIVCQINASEEYALISDTKLLKDYGEFYVLVFPFGKISNKFICQKNLLTKGTLEEFEALFDGKIERRTNRK